MPTITKKGQQRLERQNGSSGIASLEDSILALLSERGTQTEEAIEETFARFPRTDTALRELTKTGFIR
jgi:hypothetical protein